MVGMRPEAELGGDELPDRDFGGSEHGAMKSAKHLSDGTGPCRSNLRAGESW